MPKLNDGNEQDVRLRDGSTTIPGADDNLQSNIPTVTGSGTQTDLPPSGYVSVTTPSGDFNTRMDWLNTTDLCPEGLDPVSVGRIFFQILASHFSNPSNILNPKLRNMIYNENPQATGIRIDVNTTVNMATANKIPALIIKRGGQEMRRVSIGDAGQREVDYEAGEIPFVRVMKGSHSIICVAPYPAVTEELAVEIFTYFNGISPLLRSTLPFADFQVAGMMEQQIAEELGNRTVTTVQFLYEYEYGWTLSPAVPILASVSAPVTVILQ